MMELAFFVLPYYSNHSGYFLAAQTLDEKWWLELILAALPQENKRKRGMALPQ